MFSLLPVPVSMPVISKTPESELVEDRDNVTLTCSVEHGTNVQYKWLKNNMVVGPSEQHTFAQDYGTLVINPIKKEDIGNYICEARNHISSKLSQPTELIVFCEYLLYFLTSSSFIICYHPMCKSLLHYCTLSSRFLLQPENYLLFALLLRC